ncbi:glutamine amidotransferase family protein [Rhizobiales bacterium]|uniref:class II glutamine amidotransferase n=1 Tax=Hongsoonwoonella zoysiae TaxID=2821844 RepID=UPI0015608419|nr:glutamine amidotransferase family protein [Hongsoonwoonella zoysiae]NRG17765.1 glutamine amidotransferase family protein [Hongsoonwoonella zoysiae]
MCGIVGLFLKDRSLQPELGSLLSDMLVTMTERGPDSAGIAIYGADSGAEGRLTIQADDRGTDFDAVAARLGEIAQARVTAHRRDSHAVLVCPPAAVDAVREALERTFPEITLMSFGSNIEIYKETGLPSDVVDRFGIRSMGGTHGIGHTRMATESAVTTCGAHPFSTGADECLVHNGSLSNHNRLRSGLEREGIRFATDNDSEVAAAYLSGKMRDGADLGEALNAALSDLDGFFTFVVGTRSGFGVVRDPIACKPAVMAENDRYVAFGSEYRALAGLPGIEDARVWEPEPATVYFWSHRHAAA